MTSAHHHHGNVLAGRIMAAVGALLILAADGLIFKIGAIPHHPVPIIQVVTAISALWMLAGTGGMILRKGWSRYLALTVLYAGSFGWFLTIIITWSDTEDATFSGQLRPLMIATALHVYVSLVFTYSRHIHRLTSRAWD